MKLTEARIEKIKVAPYVPLFQNEKGAIDVSRHNTPGNVHESKVSFNVSLSIDNIILSTIVSLLSYMHSRDIDKLSQDERMLLAKAHFIKQYQTSEWNE